MPTLLPRLLDSDVLPLVELQAARLDGELYGVGEAFAMLDTPDTADLRALAFRMRVTHAVVADRQTALWIHGARAGPPATLQVCVDSARRVSANSLHGLDVRQCILARDDVVQLGGARVTSPLRTALDLLRSADGFTSAFAIQLRALLDLAGADTDECRERLRRHDKILGTRSAYKRLAALDALEL